jgi:hypothetical protein
MRSSSSSLSPLPGSPTLPVLPCSSQTLGSTLSCGRTPKPPSLPKSNAYIFVQGLFTRTLLSTIPATVQYSCTNCSHSYTSTTTNVTSTSNIIKHYNACHKGIPATKHNAIQRQRAENKGHSQFFQGKSKVLTQDEFRKLLLEFIVCNDLALRICESPSFQALITALQP